MNLATLNRFTRLLREITNIAACPRAIIAVSYLFDRYQ